jgi:hypothetical protein
MLNLLSGILSGYGETALQLQKQQHDEEIARRSRRASVISQAIPGITDPSLHAEAVALLEEIVAGKGKKKGGLAGVLAALAGGQAEDTGQGAKVKEFITRPRQAVTEPGGTATLPEIPGMPPGVAATLPSEVTWPATQGTVKGPFPTPAESAAAAGTVAEAQARVGANVKAEIAGREARRLATEARGFGLTSPADIANYVRGHMVVPTGETAVAGTMPGDALIGRIATDVLGNPIEREKQYHVTRGPGGAVVSAYPATEPVTHVAGAEFSPDADSSTGYSRLMRDWRTGKIVSVERDVLPPAGWAPTVSTSQMVRFVQRGDDIVPVPVTTTTTRQKVTPTEGKPALPAVPGTGPPAATAAGAGKPGPVVGWRPLPEASRANLEMRKQAVGNSIPMVTRILANSKVLDSLISAGKIQMAISPNSELSVALSRGVPWTAEEVQLAADMQGLAEHINTLRSYLGAQGFRSREAFGALQAQRGNLLANPAITRAVMLNTMRALLSQNMAVDKTFARSTRTVPVPDRIAVEGYTMLAHGDLERAKQLMKEDGYDVAAVSVPTSGQGHAHPNPFPRPNQ